MTIQEEQGRLPLAIEEIDAEWLTSVLTYYLANSLDPVDRRRHEEDLVRLYLTELAEHGVAAPSYDEMTRYMWIFLAFGLVVFIINENFYQTEEFNTLHAMRFSVAMMDHDSKELILEAAKSDPYLTKSR